MRLPNADRAVVEEAKLRDYCLSEEHPRGRHKARVFFSALGITANHTGLLQNALLDAAQNVDAVPGEIDEFGNRYVIEFSMEWQGRSAMIRSAWIVRTGEDYARLVTCHVV